MGKVFRALKRHGVDMPDAVIASQCAHWRGNLRIRVTDSHVATLLGMTGRGRSLRTTGFNVIVCRAAGTPRLRFHSTPTTITVSPATRKVTLRPA